MKRWSLSTRRPELWEFGTLEFVAIGANWGFPKGADQKPWFLLAFDLFGFGVTVTYWPKGAW